MGLVALKADGGPGAESLHEPAEVALRVIGRVAALPARGLAFLLLFLCVFLPGPFQVALDEGDLRRGRYVLDLVEKALVQECLRPLRVRTLLVHVVDPVDEGVGRSLLFGTEKKGL